MPQGAALGATSPGFHPESMARQPSPALEATRSHYREQGQQAGRPHQLDLAEREGFIRGAGGERRAGRSGSSGGKGGVPWGAR